MSSSPFYLRAVLQPTLAVLNATATAADSGGEGNSMPAVDPTGNVLTGDTDTVGTIAVQVWLTAGSNAESVDIGLSYDASAASYVSTAGPAGWQTLGNDVSAGSVLVSGYDPSLSSPNPIATTADSLFATVTFTPTGTSSSLAVALTSGDYSDIDSNSYTPSLPAASTFSLAGGLTVTAVAAGTGASETAGTVGTALAGAHGSLTLNADGGYTYTVNTSDPAVAALATGQSLTDVFTYTVTDAAEHTRTATLTVTVDGTNHPPVASVIPDASATVGSLFTDTVTAFTDPDYASSQISYTVSLAGGGALPSWLTFDPSTLTFSGTPPAGSAGSLTLDLTGTDPSGLSGVATFGLTVASAAPCFHAGTEIATPRGAVAVETLRPGDLVDTISGEAKPIVWVGRRRADCRDHPEPRKIWPVRILADAFGDGRPVRDLVLSPDHAVLFNSVLIPIKYLVNETTVIQEQASEVDYFHIELRFHDVIWAEGLPTETYLDTGDRANFENGGFLLTLYPDFASRIWEAEGFAPLCLTGPVVEEARRLLLARADALAPNGGAFVLPRAS